MIVAAREPLYTSRLQAGLGLVSETKILLDLWAPSMSASQLHQIALESGRFPTVTARRLRNIVTECFAPRYLVDGCSPVAHLKRLAAVISTADLMQFMLIFTCRANPILSDFVRQVYWTRYAGGYTKITNDNARAFVEHGIESGKTVKRWSETTVRRVSAYLTGCCADYGMLEQGLRSSRRILPFYISQSAVAYLAYDLHFSGIGDNALLAHQDWQLFGLVRQDVLNEVKRLALSGLLICQAVGEVIRISWKLRNMEALCNVLAQN
jgi:hypothetical protein